MIPHRTPFILKKQHLGTFLQRGEPPLNKLMTAIFLIILIHLSCCFYVKKGTSLMMCPFAHGYLLVDIVMGDEYKRNHFFQIWSFPGISRDDAISAGD